MNRDEAIAIIRKEYLCVDRDCDIDRSCGKCDLMMPSKEPILEAYKMAIKALEQEPKTDSWSIKDVADTFKKHGLIRVQESSGDAIDRKLVCAFIAGLISDDGERKKGLEYIRNMPPVNPTKTAKWILIDKELSRYKCSECGEVIKLYKKSEISKLEKDETLSDYPFSHCGARMIEPQKRSDKE